MYPWQQARQRDKNCLFYKGPGYLATKIHEVENTIEGFHPPILGISEANLFQDHDKQAVQVQDYNLHTGPTLSNPGLKSEA